MGLYGFLEGLGFAGGKDGQIDKFFNPLNLLNPLKFYPLLFKSFFGKRDETEISAGGGETAVVADNQELAHGACHHISGTLLHENWEGQFNTAGNIAIPYSPSEIDAGPVYTFSAYHLMMITDPLELFPISYEEF